MTLTLIGFLVLTSGALFSVFAQRRLLQAVIFFASFSATSTINFANFGLSPAVTYFGFFVVLNLMPMHWLRSARVSRDHLALVLLLLGFGALALVLLLYNGAYAEIVSFQVTQMIYLLVGILMAVVLSFELMRPGRIEDAFQAMRAAATFIACWGFFQAACYYTGIPYPGFLFNNSNSHFADMFDQRVGGLIRIASVATEPSFLSTSLMIFGALGATLIAVEPRFRTRATIIPVGLTLLVVIASTSTVGFFGLAVLAVLLGLRRPGLVVVGLILALVALGLVVTLVPEFGQALYAVTFGKSSSTSYADRTGSNLLAIDTFFQRPVFGWGWGASVSYNIVLYLLANLGIVGTGLFVILCVGTLVASVHARSGPVAPDQWRLLSFAMGLENAFIVYMAMSVASGFKFVMPDFWCLWALAIAVPSILRCSAPQVEPAARLSAVVPQRLSADLSLDRLG